MDQTNSVRIRKSVSKAELKSRLYDKGISVQTMPSVKRPIPENVKPYAAKLNIGSAQKPPVHGASTTSLKPPPYILNTLFSGTQEENAGLSYKPSTSQLGVSARHMKSQSSEPFMKASDRFQKSQTIDQEEEPVGELYGGLQTQTLDPSRPMTTMEFGQGMARVPSSLGKSIQNPQFTTLNMAPYSRPQTQAFGFRNIYYQINILTIGGKTLQTDPSKKAIRASEEVTSITGVKTMTPLGPSTMLRPKTSSQDLLKKRSQSNKQMKRRIIGGKSELEEKRKQLVEQLKVEDEERKITQINNSPSRKPNEKVVAGNQEFTDEILRSHYLMHKIRSKEYIPPIQRPQTSDVLSPGSEGLQRPSSMFGMTDNKRNLQSATDIRQRPSTVSNSKLGILNLGTTSRNYFNQSKMQQEQIEEQQHEDDQNDDTETTKLQKRKPGIQSQQLDLSKASDKVVTNAFNKTNKQQQAATAKWNDLDKLITLLQNQPDDDGYFIYLKPSDVGDPYDLQPLIEADTSGKSQIQGAISKKSVSAQKVEKFFTLSKKGITTYINDEPVEYISLTDWLIERNFYQQISDKKFFSDFRRWKIIRMWRRNILQKKREEVKNNLTEKLFMLDDIFGPILTQHREICKDMENLRIIDLNQPGQEVLQLSEFAANQSKKREFVVAKIEEASETCRNKFRYGINQVLEDLRQKINDQNEDEETQKKDYIKGTGTDGAKEKKSLNSDPVFEQLGFKHNLKYGPRSKLRRACSRFLRFSYLLDFVALEALSNIYIESVRDTAKKLKSLAEIVPDFELRPARSAFGDQPAAPQKKSGNNQQLALFSVNGMFEEFEIMPEHCTLLKIDKFDPPPVGHSKEEDFDPVVHLELMDENAANIDEEQELNLEEDENFNKVERIKVINLNRIWLTVQPQKSDFSGQINECFQEGLECLKHFERWSRHEELLPYVKVLESWDDKVCDEWDPPDDNNLNCDDWLQENYYFMNQSDIIHRHLSQAFENVIVFFTQLEPFLQCYWENKQLGDFEKIQDERLKNPTDVIPLLLQRFNDQKTNFENLIPQYRELVRRRIDAHKQWLLKQIDSISRTPTNVETYVKQIQCLDYIDKNIQSVKDRIDLNSQIFNICITYEIESKEEKNKKFVDEVYTILSNLNSAIGMANDSADKRKEQMKTKIANKQPKLKKKVEQFNDVIMQDKFLDIKSRLFDILNEIDALEKTSNALVDKSKKIQEFQKTLDMDVNPFDYVEDAKKEFTFRARLWRALAEWQELIEKWKTSPFDQIEVTEITSKADQFTKTVMQCERYLPTTSTAVQRLKKLVFDFRETMPIVEALGNKNLKNEHWEEIKQILNIPDYPLEQMQFNLGELIGFNVADFQEDLINVSVTATQEFELRNQLEAIKATWTNNLDFKLARHKDKEAWKLVELDVIQQTLDDSLTNISNIIGSRYVKRLQSEAESWQQKLNMVFDTLEQWKEFQRNWLYLENIFASPDIRKNNLKDSQDFDQINRQWVKLMKLVQQKPGVLINCQSGQKYHEFLKHNALLDKIQKNLEAYLETKRQLFPRFYFLSNDELLQILANAADIKAVEKHINKCFDNICGLNLIESGGPIPDIQGMVSGEKEEVQFINRVKVKNNGVEVWMKSVETSMVSILIRKIKEAQGDYYKEKVERKEWVLNHIGQAVTTVSQIAWTEGCEIAIGDMDDNPLAIQEYLMALKQQLGQLTVLISGSLTPIKRKILVSLITTDVHARDIVENLVKENVETVNDFNWQQQLRYYFEEDQQMSQPQMVVIVRQVNATINYGYEYMGATSRLVITPLTDRCWMTITGAMHIKLGAAPAGPAGTGKTESTKDLAKALGIYCVVFNCSEQIEYKMMARLFSGLAQSGAWSCLDEFNRIDVEVLSVIAQQLLDIREAKLQGKDKFNFNGVVDMDLKQSCGVFVTMNPGYAGRTELPDNLKVLFRPVSMMIPNYGLIAEIMLFAEGFGNAKNLSTKMVQLYKLASEQLSQQDHYDFGMRAVKSVLVMAGSLKRANPELSEDVVLIRAMRDSNIPKFLADDLPLFNALIQDLFPGVEIGSANYGELQEQVVKSIHQMGLQPVPEFITKIIQLYDTFNVRFGVMIVGATGGGKTTCYRVLGQAMTALSSTSNKYSEVRHKVLNPKSISMGELYGEDDPDTKEWTDGLASKIIRKFAKDDLNRQNWCVFDGPVDALWIENMNTVLDDNMTLCLANGERIKLKWAMRMLFEVQDLAVASPATVSRCGMVYMTPSELGWKPYVNSWLNSYIKKNDYLNEEAIEVLQEMFMMYVDDGFTKIKPFKDEEPMPTVPVQVVKCICNFLEYFIKNKNCLPLAEKKEVWAKKLMFFFGFSYIWAFGASFKSSAVRQLDGMLREFFQGKLHIPLAESVFEYYFNEKEQKFVHWNKIIPAFNYDPKLPFFSLLVPTVDTVRYSTLLDMLLQINKPVFFTGSTGVGKSIVVQNYLSQNQEKNGLAPIMLTFSAQTSSISTQKTIEGKLINKRGKKCIGCQGISTCVIFVDDVNMPMVERYGAQPPIELLRQLLDFGGFYDRPNFYWKEIEKFIILCAAAPPGGGRSPLTPRFMRHFHILNIPDPSEDSMRLIFESIIKEFLVHNHFTDNVRKCGNVAVSATIDMYTQITKGLLPIPAKFHYTFNLRDVAKVFQGMLMTKTVSIKDADQFTRLWIHECQRVFNDRLINEEDRGFFRELTCDLLKSKFKVNWKQEDIFEGRNQIIFSMLLRLDNEDKLYEEILDKNKLFKMLEDKLTDYNISNNNNKMDLVFFEDAINHVCRITRILRQPRGNAMLIGVSGCGKQSLTRLSSFMLEYKCCQIKLSKNYKPVHFRDDLKVQMLDAGCDSVQSTFLITDTQIMYESFLEDINNILNTGEITNLYQKEDFDRMMNSLVKINQQMKRPETKDYIYQTYIERVRDNFHIILCMSPVGDQLRIRCRKFPSLVNCCTLDWFDNWPEEALLNVSRKFLLNLENADSETKAKLSLMFTKVHKSVEEMSELFWEELRRKVYITPKSYLDGIGMYLNQLAEKRKEYKQNIFRLSNGCQKLKLTNEQIAGLQVNLGVLIPKLEEENKNSNVKAVLIKDNKVIASQKEAVVEEESAYVQQEAQKIEQMKKANDLELAKCKPALEEAERAVGELSKESITELKSFKQPPEVVELALRCVFVYLGYSKQDWKSALGIISDIKFLDRLKLYDTKNIQPKTITAVKAIILQENFNVQEMSTKSKVAGALAKWCKALYEYAEAWKIVKPKEQKQRELSEKLAIAEAEVAQKKAELYKIKQDIAQMEADYENIQNYIKQLSEDKTTCERRLENAGKLIGLLGDEGERWQQTVEVLNKEVEKLIGDVFIAAASVSYMGPFTGAYRDRLIEQWSSLCRAQQIPVSEKYSLVYTLGNPIEIRTWNLCSLPSDSVSIDNGILATKTLRWPLMIDPQTQANTWIKKMCKESHGFKVIKLSEGYSYQKDMETAIQTGATVLIEDVSQELDPGLDSILNKAVYKEDNLEKINFGDRTIIYDKRFRLFITTKLANPHFLPEICIKLTVINFTVTFDGLEEQLLADVVIREAPEVEQKRDTLVMEIAGSKNELKRLENKILKDLAESNQDTILDNQDLIDTLEISKAKSKIIAESLVEAEEVEKTINETRNSYRDVSIRGSILYFVIGDLATIDPMYQNSLAYVKKLFNDAILASPSCQTLSERIEVLKNTITKTLYVNICRGLFEEHKLIYSFLICTSIKRKGKEINEIAWNYLLRGAGLFNKSEQPSKPENSDHIFNEPQWDLAYCLEHNLPDVFAGLCRNIADNLSDWENYVINEEEQYLENIPCGYGNSLGLFDKLLILKVFKPEKLMFAFSKYVEIELGKQYAESPIATMDALFADSDKKTPIIFVLSQGADPTWQVIQFAHKMNFYERFQYKSLGQGQEKVATEMIEQGKREGHWVLLQNCHLFKSWMPQLEAICERFRDEEHLIHSDFRLIMTSMPADYFPAAILQNGLKMTTEPPRGIKANLKRSYNNLITEDTYNSCKSTKEGIDNQNAFRRLLFGLCFFHASVQERRKFGPLGWNIRYEFNDSDLDTSIQMLRNFLIDTEEIPWDAMKYMTGQINYGGRVTDDWDRILLLNILQRFYNDEILQDNYQFSSSGIYFVPTHSSLLEIQEYIDSLPLTEEPEVFGLHQNANIAFQQQESEKIVTTILNVQPRVVTGAGGKSSDDIIYELAEELEANLPQLIDREDHAKDIFKPNSKGLLHCLSTVLLQEIERYNRLLAKMGTTLALIMKAIKGLVIMSPELDLMYSALLKNQVPPNWAEVAYPSLKPLASWIKDLNMRVEFMRNWLKGGHPSCYWLSGFFFPHGFMTGTLQTFARKHLKAIDLLTFRFSVLQETSPEEIERSPEDGIYVYGLFVEGAKWSRERACLDEQQPGEMISTMPIIHFLPQEVIRKDQQNAKQQKQQEDSDLDDTHYKCPVYKTSVRAGVLSTTGQSTNFILAIDLACSENETPEHWTLRGTALLTMLND